MIIELNENDVLEIQGGGVTDSILDYIGGFLDGLYGGPALI